MDLHNADNYFHAFTYPNWKHIVSFGKRGEGPEEMLSAETFQFNSLDSIYALDANKMRSHAGRFQQKTIQLQDRK